MSLKEFFLITLPGFEELAQREVLDWYPEAETVLEHGGVSLMLPFSEGLSLNLVLKIPTRILVRVERFKCRDFPKLYQKIVKINWRDWIKKEVHWDVSVASHGSRLSIKKRIKETCEDALEKKFPQNKGDNDSSSLTLYVRLSNDVCTLSLDTSAHLLHKRTGEKRIGIAPIRETIGAAMVQTLAQHANVENSVDVVDPMMGSGTLLMEAALRDTPTSAEHFSFEIFRVKNVKPPTLQSARPKVIRLIGIEADKKTKAASEVNFTQANLPIPVEIHHQDIFKMKPLEKPTAKRWVLCNPPYGKRIKVSEPLKSYYENLFLNISLKLFPSWACVLIPNRGVKGKLKLPAGWQVKEKLKFNNGGFPVTAYIFKCSYDDSEASTPDSRPRP